MAASDDVVKKSAYNKLVIALMASLIAAAFMGGYIVGNLGEQNVPQEGPGLTLTEIAPSSQTRVTIPIGGNPVMGNPDAPVTMIEYTDFQCPYCDRFFSQTLPLIEKAYIATGKVKFVFKNMPLETIHPNAIPAAIAAECANEQGKFWEYHDKLFEGQSAWARLDNADAIAVFKQYASDTGLDASSFGSCIDSSKYADKVSAESKEGRNYGVNGTPAFFIGNEKEGYLKLAGAQPFSVFQEQLDSQLG
jgi:protein-disulfide isomerase